jgi:hypothetical protein
MYSITRHALRKGCLYSINVILSQVSSLLNHSQVKSLAEVLLIRPLLHQELVTNIILTFGFIALSL